jgi:tetratricopeptide (TPR) repeat protein
VLVQDTAYGTLLRDRRRQLHARIAATLEDLFPEIVSAQPALLAHHCTEAGLTEKAVDYWLTAGRQAWARSALAEAIALLHRGLALVPDLPDADSRRGREFDHSYSGEFSAARADLEQFFAHYDPTQTVVLTGLTSYDPLVGQLANSALLLVCLGHLDRALSRRDAAVEEARRLSHSFSLAVALSFNWLVGWCIRSEPRSLLQHANEYLPFSAEHGLGFQQALGLAFRGWCLAALENSGSVEFRVGNGEPAEALSARASP